MNNAPPHRGFWFLSILLVIWGTVLVPLHYPGFHFGTLLDTDPYMRLARVERLYESGLWFESVFPRDNAPFGNDLHWTRPVDVLLIIVGVVLAPFFGFKKGLFLGSHLINPLFLLMGVWLLEWGLRNRLDLARRLLVVGGVLIQPVVFSYCSSPRIDHHAAQVFLLCAAIAHLSRFAYEEDASRRRRGLRWLGVISAVGLWISFEFLTAFLLTVGSLWSFWIFGRRDFRREQFTYLAWTFVALVLALLVERGGGAFSAWEIDRLSAMHIVLLLAVATTGGVTRLLPEPTGALRRGGLLVGAAAGVGVLLMILFPDVLRAPFNLVDPRVDAIFHADVVEIHSVYHHGKIDWNVAENLIFALVAIPFLALRFRRRGADPLWLIVAIGVLLWVPLGLYQQRHALFAQIILVFPLVSVAYIAFLRAGRSDSAATRVALRSLVLVAAMGGPVALSAIRAVTEMHRVGATTATAVGKSIDLQLRKEMMHYLGDPDRFPGAPLVVMAEIDLSTMLVFESPHAIVASPYHRNVDGVVDANAFFLDEGEEVARAIAERRGVDLVLIERPRRDDRAPADGSGEPLGTRLLCGRGPAWIVEQPIPPQFEGRYTLFKVNLGS